MGNFRYPDDSVMAFQYAVLRSDIPAMRRFRGELTNLMEDLRPIRSIIVPEVGREASPAAIRALIELGYDVNLQDLMGATALVRAVMGDRYDNVKTLLECGADPNLDCPIFRVASQQVAAPIEMAQLLLDHGADINQLFLVEGLPPRTVLGEAIMRGKTELVEFLKAHGAKLPQDLPGGQPAGHRKRKSGRPDDGADADTDADPDAEIIAHFRKYYGKPADRAVREIVASSEYPVAVHYIPPGVKRKKMAFLFTTGLSRFEMPVPKGAEAFRRAELVVALPPDWPAPDTALNEPRWAWPIQWLQKIANYPVAENTWLGARWTGIINDDPPQPLGPGTIFTAWLLASVPLEKLVIRRKDGTKIQIYQLIPLYTEEYELEQREGAEALMKRFEKRRIRESIDVNRPNVALSK